MRLFGASKLIFHLSLATLKGGGRGEMKKTVEHGKSGNPLLAKKKDPHKWGLHSDKPGIGPYGLSSC